MRSNSNFQMQKLSQARTLQNSSDIVSSKRNQAHSGPFKKSHEASNANSRSECDAHYQSMDHVEADQSGGFGKINIPRLNENSGAYLPNNIQGSKVSPYTPI